MLSSPVVSMHTHTHTLTQQDFSIAVGRLVIIPCFLYVSLLHAVKCVSKHWPTHTHTYVTSLYLLSFSTPWKSSLARLTNEVIIGFHLFKTTQLVQRP